MFVVLFGFVGWVGCLVDCLLVDWVVMGCLFLIGLDGWVWVLYCLICFGGCLLICCVFDGITLVVGLFLVGLLCLCGLGCVFAMWLFCW